MSPAPATSGSFANGLYRLLGPLAALDGGDEARAWSLLHYCSGIGLPFQLVADFVYEQQDGTPGWGLLLDADRCPTWALGWLAQFRGVRLVPRDPAETEAAYWAAMRQRIKRADGQNRGGPDAMRAAAERFLTGTRYLVFNERAGAVDPAYTLAVRSRADETPDPAKVLAAILEQKPGGIVLDYATTPSGVPTYDLVAVAHDSYQDVLTFYADYDDLRTRMP